MNFRRCCAALTCWMSIAALAAPAVTERDRIAAERAAVLAKFAEQERGCRAQFIVIACVDAARKEQRSALGELLRQQALLDDSRRREAAAARRQTIQARAAARPARAVDAVPAIRRETTRRAPTPHPSQSAGSADESRARTAADRSPSAEQRSAEQRNEAKFDTRARAAQLHREAVQRRNAQRAAQGRVPEPLPLPGATSAP